MNRTFSRRDLLRFSSAGLLGIPAAGWLDQLAAQAATDPAVNDSKCCILLFMSGGPSHIDTFDPKPKNASRQFKPIATNVPGIQFTENLPLLAKQATDLAVLRGMSTGEADHGRARYVMHTGYRQGTGGLIHPALGAIVSATLGQATDVLPNFVSIDPKNAGRANGSGYLGPMHAPLELHDPDKGVENMAAAEDAGHARRLSLLADFENTFIGRLRAPSAFAHQAMYQRANALMRSSKAKAFDLSQESDASRAAYGDSSFGKSCLVARRLVEAGVKYVEIDLGSWDTHTENLKTHKELCAQVDPAMTALINDLRERGRLDSTLVVWMGEFGRTPTLGEGRGDGRGHYAKAWTTVLAGAGLRTGQVIGRTDDQGGTVVDRPISTVDYLATICRALGIDYTRTFTTSEKRPVRIVDKDETVVSELF